MDRHRYENTEVTVQKVQIPLFLLKLMHRSLGSNTKKPTLPTLCITGKLECGCISVNCLSFCIVILVVVSDSISDNVPLFLSYNSEALFSILSLIDFYCHQMTHVH